MTRSSELFSIAHPQPIICPMTPLELHELHAGLGACFGELNGFETVSHYGNESDEGRYLADSVGVIDLGFRSRLCLVGNDRSAYLHGQVTNNVNSLTTGTGCYAAIVSNKGKLVSDVNIYCLAEELLLDFEPGLTRLVTERLEKFIVSDDVEVCDVGQHFGLLSIQGPKAADTIKRLDLGLELPDNPLAHLAIEHETLGQLYLMNHVRGGSLGFDLFAETRSLPAIADKLITAARELGGGACGWEALEADRIEAGIPRFGQDMDETHLAPEAGIEKRAISYAKGCYVGQEVINRIHSVGHVNRALCRLKFEDSCESSGLPGSKLFFEGKNVGYITSAVRSPRTNTSVGLGYVRREANATGTRLALHSESDDAPVVVTGMVGEPL